MATRRKRSDEGGSNAEQGRIEGPHGDTEMDQALDDLEEAGLAAGGRADVERALGRSGPDNQDEAAEDALSASSEDEDEAQTHDRRRPR